MSAYFCFTDRQAHYALKFCFILLTSLYGNISYKILGQQACKVSNGSSGKSSSNKMAKQAAMEFVKRTLNRCHKYEDTGKSFFSEPSFREIYSSWSVNPNGERQSDPVDGESYASIQSLDARVSGV